MPQNEQASPAEMEIRLGVIREKIAAGLTQAQIVKYVREKCADWNVSDRQARNYYLAVWREYGNEATGIDRAAYFVRTIERLDYIYGAAMKISDFRTALSATGELIKLLRLDLGSSADFDWKKAAKDAGVSPSDLFEKVVQAVQASQELAHADESAN